ncbi:tetratricopeptide repeat protein [bacterium]|nr:tetratricopeptide repeat protein [bacterium]
MAQRFQKIVGAPQHTFERARKKITAWHPRTPVGHVGRLVGISGTGIFEFLLWAVKYATLDNPMLRDMEDKIRNLQTNSIWWRHPNLSAHVLWWFMLGGVVLSAWPQSDEMEEGTEPFYETHNSATDVPPVAEKKFAGFCLNPLDQQAWRADVMGVHPYVLAHIISSEGFIERAYDDNAGNGTLTLGSGFTIDHAAHRAFAQQILGRRIGNWARIDVDENRVLVSEWLRQVIYPNIQQNLTRPVDGRLFVILAVAAYNKGHNIYAPGNSGYPVIQAINAGKSVDEIANAYVRAFAGPRGTRWPGLINKYGVCALYYKGNISDGAILASVAEAPYRLEKHIRQNRGRLVTYDGSGEDARPNGVIDHKKMDSLLMMVPKHKTKGTLQDTVGTYLNAAQCDAISRGVLAGADACFHDFMPKKTAERLSRSDALNITGEELYFDKKYSAAIKKFQAALDKDPRNYIAYANMVICYCKMGRPERGLAVMQNLMGTGLYTDMPGDMRGAMYYGAALCRVALGDAATRDDVRRTHYTAALENLKLAEKFSGDPHEGIQKAVQAKINPAPQMRAAAAKVKSQTRVPTAKGNVVTKNEGR